MGVVRITRTPKAWLSAFAAAATMAMLVLTGLFVGSTHAQQLPVTLSEGPGAPGASGIATIEFVKGEAVGTVEVDNLPPQPFGSGRFYGVWFVRGDDKAFLGALIREQSIIFSSGGDGETRFAATRFTTGPNAGSSIAFGPAGTNVIIVLIEKTIDGLMPSPVGPVPGTGVAVVGTF